MPGIEDMAVSTRRPSRTSIPDGEDSKIGRITSTLDGASAKEKFEAGQGHRVPKTEFIFWEGGSQENIAL